MPTTGNIANGAIIEKEIAFELSSLSSLNLSLRNPDLTTAKRVSEVINKTYGDISKASDPSTINIQIPSSERVHLVHFLTKIEQLTVTPDYVAKIIIDDQDGVIVMGENVRISTVAVTHGNITIRINETPEVSQPNSFTAVQQATIIDRSAINIKEENSAFVVLNSGVTLQDLVKALNAMGATPKDLISILRSIKAAGAIQADIEVI